jgi:hypothetical protein
VYVRLPLDDARLASFLDAYVPTWRDDEAWHSDEPPASTTIGEALDGRRAGFTLYSGRVRDGLPFAMVAAPRDGGLVVGLSTDTSDDAARTLLRDLLATTGATEGFVTFEEPPPMDDAEWREAVTRPGVYAVGADG